MKESDRFLRKYQGFSCAIVVGKTSAPSVLSSFKIPTLKLSTKVDVLVTYRGIVLMASGQCINTIFF
jgi:hypothetical protein